MAILIQAPSTQQFQRNITIVDPDAAQIPVWDVSDTIWTSIGAVCNITGGILTFRLVCFDQNGFVVGVMGPYTFMATSPVVDFRDQFLGNSSDNGLTALYVAAPLMGMKVDSVTGVWTVTAQGFHQTKSNH
jgi:hypothetical protein